MMALALFLLYLRHDFYLPLEAGLSLAGVIDFGF
jgi:hypothetical protein